MVDIRSFPDGARLDVAEALAVSETREVNELLLPRYLQAVRLAAFAAYHVKAITADSAFSPEERTAYMDRAFDGVLEDYLGYRRYEDFERREAQPDVAAPSPQEPSA